MFFSPAMPCLAVLSMKNISVALEADWSATTAGQTKTTMSLPVSASEASRWAIAKTSQIANWLLE